MATRATWPTSRLRPAAGTVAVLYYATIVGLNTPTPLSVTRRLVGGVALVPSALVGALVLAASDLAAQHVLGGTTLPVGVVTAVVGGPYLLWLLAVTNRVGRGG
ncbi:iron chelate uptake ABC transporter family permease subunit [Actinophytocola gossypii]|uniref:Iron chelate uptake ABC transporter family permease subunit n=1 Tax=Actinophytocola gossypii TaxID=2812003 RepID=A0ABT2J4X6_9PSEU|nr:iron chelate uptake ABC transporter family permease subunit [Actinophytocola gossypii]MCT2582902.1 iron chelate uptake ABC transporter family permease subunit [Actinophytocola gossypii]